jgi:hypothetical protein
MPPPPRLPAITKLLQIGQVNWHDDRAPVGLGARAVRAAVRRARRWVAALPGDDHFVAAHAAAMVRGRTALPTLTVPDLPVAPLH